MYLHSLKRLPCLITPTTSLHSQNAGLRLDPWISDISLGGKAFSYQPLFFWTSSQSRCCGQTFSQCVRVALKCSFFDKSYCDCCLDHSNDALVSCVFLDFFLSQYCLLLTSHILLSLRVFLSHRFLWNANVARISTAADWWRDDHVAQ